MEIFDGDVWPTANPNDLWVYDKLILSRKLGYICGPAGVSVPQPNRYIVRPITNINGMGRSAKFVHIKNSTDHIQLGYFWCEIFEGRHLSVDYKNQQQILCVEGFRTSDKLYKWDKWKVVSDIIPFPPILLTLIDQYDTINCEFIGGNLIEVHLRFNPDFVDDRQELLVVWEGEDTTPPTGMKFVESKDYKRIGFFTPIL